MDRREALKSGLGAALVAVGVSEVKTVSGSDDIELVILKIPKPEFFLKRTGDEPQGILSSWKECVKGTCLENVKAIAMVGGVDIEVVRKSVRVQGGK